MNQAAQISEAIFKLNRLYRMAMDEMLKDFKLTKPQLSVIGQIFSEPKTIGQITEAIQLSYSTVSGIIDRLERDGWLQRVRDKSDRRVIWIQKTEQIIEIRNKLQESQEKMFGIVLGDLSGEQLDSITESLHLLIKQLEKPTN